MITLTYRARWVLPMDGQPIDDGEVVVEDGCIAAVRRQSHGQRLGSVRDFGNAVLLPGLINAHTHLEYTALRGFLEDIPFFPWVRSLYAAKSSLTADDWLWSARLGALESIAAGVTTIGDNTDAGVTMAVANQSGLRGIIYQEVFGIDHRVPVQETLSDLGSKIANHRQTASDRVGVGISPHALYTVRPDLMTALNEYVLRENLATSIHIAESLDESQLTQEGVGEFADMFARRGIIWDCPHQTPTQFANALGVLQQSALAVHCVQQTPEDIALLAATGAAVVHCPKSNAKLGAGIAPLADWLRTPCLRVALGTDSAVSNNTLDLWEEMRFALLVQRAARARVEVVTAFDVLRMATLGGAEAMGIGASAGSLTPGKRADVIAVSLNRPNVTPATDPYAALVYSAQAADVAFTMCDGVVLYDIGRFQTMDAPSILSEAATIRQKAAAPR